jgi:glutathione synthase
VVLMRRDPPFDNEYVYATYILEAAERRGTLIVNRCQSLRDCNEKIFATQFPECCPPVLVSGDSAQLKAFHASTAT